PANFVSNASVILPNAISSRDCLESCFRNNSLTGCRLVSYNLDTTKCMGFTSEVDGTFRPDASFSLLAVSRKQSTAKVGFVVSGTAYIHGADGQYVANNGWIFDEGRGCVKLCHIHPRCTAIFSLRDNYIASNDPN